MLFVSCSWDEELANAAQGWIPKEHSKKHLLLLCMYFIQGEGFHMDFAFFLLYLSPILEEL
jgi:hypothetical protein